MAFVRWLAVASFALVGFISPATADKADGDFTALATTLKSTLTDTGARGEALMIGEKSGTFYAANAGKATLDTPINLSGTAGLTHTAMMLALVDCDLLSLNEPIKKYLPELADARGDASVRQLIIERARGGPEASDATKSLGAIAVKASGRPWGPLFTQLVADPLGMTATQYAKPAGVIHTTGRDYALLLSSLANGSTKTEDAVLSPQMVNLLFRSQIVGAASCARQDETALCTLIEEDSVGLYAWVDRARGIYGVLSAPGAEVPVAKAGRELRAEAETIYDRQHAGAGLTSSIGN